MTNHVRSLKRIGTLALAFSLTAGLGLLAGCGGSSGSSGGPGSTPARAFGEIESLGSIVVNGVTFEVEDGLVVGPDNQTPAPGMVVEVEGEINPDGVTGFATAVTFDDNVKGPLTEVTGDAGVAVGQVMGQTVIFEDNVTKFDPATGVPLGDDVDKVFQVSGFQDETGTIHATFVREIADGGVLEVTGIVSNLGATTFEMNGLTVDYSGATLRDLPPGGLDNGLLVEVKGTVFDPVEVRLTATEIEGKVRGLGDDMPKVHVEGMIANLDTSAETFSLNGQTVSYSAAAFRAGDKTDLANGIKVEAEGPLSDGTLLATRVTFKASVRVEATVASVGAATLTFLGLDGIEVLVHPDITRGFGAFEGLQVGTDVKVRARQGASDLVATRLEVEGEGTDRTIIRGPVTAVAGDIVTILGTVDVDTTSISNENFKDHDTSLGPNGRAVFFSRLREGDIVKARFRDGAWDEIEFQD
ncbi:MAG: DUF5666 domain-containing protein [Deferrisomatales bacterium]|nr:DUF5666 domain-containing protein [Deferrisomatales bacterium]